MVNPNGEYTEIKTREKTNVKRRKYILYNILYENSGIFLFINSIVQNHILAKAASMLHKMLK